MQEKKVLCGGEESSSLYAYAHLIHVTLVEPLSRPFHSVILLLPFGKARRVWEGRDDGMGWDGMGWDGMRWDGADAMQEPEPEPEPDDPHLTSPCSPSHLI